MKALQAHYRIGDLCAAFCVSRSGYHRWRTAAVSQRKGEDALLGEELRRAHARSRGTETRGATGHQCSRSSELHEAKAIGPPATFDRRPPASRDRWR